MCLHETEYVLWQQRHVGLVFLQQLLLREVTFQGLAVNHAVPDQRFAIRTDQTRRQRFQSFVRNHLHHLQATKEVTAVLPSRTTPCCVLRLTDLLGDGREFHHMKSFVVGGSALVDVDNHGGASFATEKGLKELGELALSKGNVAALLSDGQEGVCVECKTTSFLTFQTTCTCRSDCFEGR